MANIAVFRLFLCYLFAMYLIPIFRMPELVVTDGTEVFLMARFTTFLAFGCYFCSMNIYPSFWLVSFLVVPLVFLLVMAVGYIEIIRRLWCQPNPENGSIPTVIPPESERESVPVSDAKTWDEIAAEFRMMLYDIVHRFRQEIKKKQ